MAEPSLLRLEPGATYCTWYGPTGPGQGEPADAARALAGTRATLLLPGTEVLLVRAPVPVRNRGKARTAVPWALEDRLVADVEELHFALGGTPEGGEWPVAVIDRATLQHYLETLRAAGLDPQRVVAEPHGLPRPEPDEWCVLEEADRVTVRTDDTGGFSCEPDLLEGVAAALEPPERVRRWRADDVAAPAWPESLAGALEAGGTPGRVGSGVEALVADSGGIDLLQGPFSRGERASRLLRTWRVPAGLAAACLLLALVQLGLDYRALGQREAELRARMEQIFRDTFPEVQRVVNPRAQMNTRLESLRSGGEEVGFAEVLAEAGPVLTNADGVRLSALEWQGDALRLELEADELQRLDGLRRRLAEAGLQAELDRAERSGDRVEGRIRITEASG